MKEEINLLKEVDNLMSILKSLKADIKKQQKLSEKCFNMNIQQNSIRQIEKITNDLNWACMEIDKSKTMFARYFNKSMLNVSIEEKEYNPSGWHNYKG